MKTVHERAAIGDVIHRVHVRADGTQGHSGKVEWRICPHPDCAGFRAELHLPHIGRCPGDVGTLVKDLRALPAPYGIGKA